MITAKRAQTVAESHHFVPDEAIPMIDTTSTLLGVFKELASRKKGGFILSKKGKPLVYVIASELVKITTPDLARVARRRLMDLSIEGSAACLRLASSPLEVSMNLTSLGPAVHLDGVFEVIHAKKRAGWLFTKEIWSDTVNANPPSFLCEKGHVNPDPDSGRCSQFENGKPCRQPIRGWGR